MSRLSFESAGLASGKASITFKVLKAAGSDLERPNLAGGVTVRTTGAHKWPRLFLMQGAGLTKILRHRTATSE